MSHHPPALFVGRRNAVLISNDPEVEAWLAESATSFRLLHDGEYRALVERWRAAFGEAIAEKPARRGEEATQELRRRLPVSALIFNGLAIAEVAGGSTPNPCAYSVDGLRSFDPGVANPRDLVIADADLSFSYIGTHEWQGLSTPRFVESAGTGAVGCS